MIIKSKLLILLVSLLSLSLAACSGTGRKDYTSVMDEIQQTEESKLYVYRVKQRIAAGGLLQLKLNDEFFGEIGIGEVASVPIIKERNRLEVAFKKFLGLGLEAEPIDFARERGKSRYYVVDVKEGFFTNDLRVTEVTKNGLKTSLGD